MKKMMYLLFVFSLIPVVAVSADDFIDNRLQVNNSRLETEQEKTLGGNWMRLSLFSMRRIRKN